MRTDASWVWLTPVPVDEERVAAFPPFRFGESSRRNTDIEALAAAIRGFDEPVVDLVAAFGVPPLAHLQGEDGCTPRSTGRPRSWPRCSTGWRRGPERHDDDHP